MKDIILGIEVKTVSPVAIIEGSETLIGKTVTKIKKEAVFNEEENKIDYIPYIPANGFRGILRRYASKRLIEAVKSNTQEKSFNDRDLHSMLSGSGTNDQPLTYKELEIIREKNPILSLFGTGLLLGGKLNITSMIPNKDIDNRNLVRVANYTKVDDILQKSRFATLFTKEQIKEWENIVLENTVARSEQRKQKELAKESGEVVETKVKKETVQHYFGKEYIPSGVILNSSIKINNPTKLELGALITALIDFANDGVIGSSRNIGFGVIDFTVIDVKTGVEIINKYSDENYIFKSSVDINLKQCSEINEAYEEYQKWLQNATKDNIEVISKIA